MRNRKNFTLPALLWASVLGLSLTLVAQVSNTPASTPNQNPQSTPGAAPTRPGQTGSPNSPGMAPQGQPSSPNSPEQGPGNNAPSAQSTAPQNHGTTVADELQLTPDQKQKISAIVQDENQQIESVRNDKSLSLDQKQQKVMQIREQGSPKIKAVLTPEQLQKLVAIQQRMRQEQEGGSQAPPSSHPQH